MAGTRHVYKAALSNPPGTSIYHRLTGAGPPPSTTRNGPAKTPLAKPHQKRGEVWVRIGVSAGVHCKMWVLASIAKKRLRLLLGEYREGVARWNKYS